MAYGDLTEAEQAHWDEYTNLRRISDWPGFNVDMDAARAAARSWLVERRKQIWRSAQPKADGGDGKGWDVANRRERHEFLKDENLNTGAPKHEVRLPTPGSATDAEKAYMEAREVYLAFASTTDAQKARKQANVDWLVERRQDLWRLIAADGNHNGRKERYEALAIATHHGRAYEEWNKTHNKWGIPYSPSVDSSQRMKAVNIAKHYVGVVERPAGSNKGQPQPSGWQKRVIGSDGWAWCACFNVCCAWDAGVEGSGTAGVWVNKQMALKGQGMFRAYTTDRRRVRPGDFVIIGCDTCHQEMVAEPPDEHGVDTVGGNTSSGHGGSQYNGGGVYERKGTTRRTNREIVGYMLVRYTS